MGAIAVPYGLREMCKKTVSATGTSEMSLSFDLSPILSVISCCYLEHSMLSMMKGYRRRSIYRQFYFKDECLNSGCNLRPAKFMDFE